MEYAIEVRNLTKEYENFKLENASFNVGKGTIMGFIGENGAGKSTTIKAILNLIKKDNGLITVLGEEINGNEKGIKNELGIVLNDGNFNEKLNVKAINKIMKNIYKRWDDDVFYKYIEKFNIDTSKKIEEFSKGMKMKLSIAIALSHKAKILILDEATSGLDPVARDEVLDILMEFIQNEENSILMSSHITSDLEKIADYITFIHNGKIIFSENKDKLIYDMGVVKCTEKQFKTIEVRDRMFYKKGIFNYEVLIDNRDEFSKKYPSLVINNSNLEEIMLFYIKGDK
ncbi:ABC transporter ATP-binding protein [Sarcina ventriculi]|uniref:ABC transporter ATP-binding protein n=1 Tax=Sarcina ventriculi TaxID=1267 RepID=UPI001C10EAEF|nr:ABC transporter ATP-binding protein [Sarcina ventriculi]MBU5322206.1 ABC transporter ATP-binding protein [Sarcina ventriculi]